MVKPEPIKIFLNRGIFRQRRSISVENGVFSSTNFENLYDFLFLTFLPVQNIWNNQTIVSLFLILGTGI